MGRRFVVLDRDGTILVERHYLSEPSQVELITGAAEGLRQLQAMGLGLVVLTNQSAIGRGMFDQAALEAIHRRMQALLGAEGIRLDGVYVCPHRPDDGCACRKPKAGLLERAGRELGFAMRECFVIGDKACDIDLGRGVGATTVLVRTGYGAQAAEDPSVRADYTVEDLREAAQIIGRVQAVAERARLYLAGHTGLVGSALRRRLAGQSRYETVVAARAEVDLLQQDAVEAWLAKSRPDAVIIAAGRVGGILANSRRPAEFIYENLMIEANLIHGAWKAGVKRLLNFGSSCMYPLASPQPMGLEHLMTGPLEETSEPYAMAKWAGLSLCEAYNRQYGTRYLTVIPATVYGPGDSFDPDEAHVLSALIRKFHEAVEGESPDVTLWGTGRPRREFLFADDLAEACELLLGCDEVARPINVGPGTSRTIRELAEIVADVVGFRGAIRWDAFRPDGAPAKTLDASAIQAMGWRARTDLRDGIAQTYRWFLEQQNSS